MGFPGSKVGNAYNIALYALSSEPIRLLKNAVSCGEYIICAIAKEIHWSKENGKFSALYLVLSIDQYTGLLL